MQRFAILVSALMVVGMASARPQEAASRQEAIWNEVDEQLIAYVDGNFHDGDIPRAIHGCRLRYVMHPDDWDAVTDLGWLLESTEREGEALSMYIKYQSDYPERRDSAYAVVEFWFRKKAYAKIPPLVEPELAKTPHANMYRWLAHSYEKLGRYLDSVRVWDELLALSPGDQAAKNNRERVKQKLKGTPT